MELLAGIPSVGIGFFALLVRATWLRYAFGFTYRLDAITAGLGLALAVIPIVYPVAEDGLSHRPRSAAAWAAARRSSSLRRARSHS